MAVCGKLLVGILSILVVLLAILLQGPVFKGTLTKPLPKQLPNKGETRLLLVALDVMTETSALLSNLGFGKEMELRRKLTDMAVPTPDYSGLRVTNTVMDGIKVRVYEPEDDKENKPGIVFYHGGGWHWGSIDTHDIIARTVAARVGAVVVNVDYRLAPEYPYPVPLEDCEKATKYFLRNAHDYGVGDTRIAIAGDSAGGNLAAAVALKLRDTKFPIQPKLQILVYPLLQGVDFYLPSYIQNNGLVYGDRQGLALACVHYGNLGTKIIPAIVANNHTSLSDKEKYQKLLSLKTLPSKFTANVEIPSLHDGDTRLRNKVNRFFADPYVFPLMEANLEDLPEAYISTAEYDILRDEGVLYAERLKQAGVRVTWHHIEDGFHGIWNHIQPPLIIESGVQMMDHLIDYLLKTL